jgi:hypothetical protein
MRESFEKELHTYNELVKESKQEQALTKEGRVKMHEKIDTAIADTLSGKIEHRDLPKANIGEGAREAEMDIYKLQREKQNLMERFFKHTKTIEQGGIVEHIDTHTVSFDQTNRQLFYQNEKGEKVTFSKEELFTDAEWGIHYTLDASVPYNIQKEYLVNELKREIGEKLDAQIIKRETFSDKVHEWKKKAYEAISGAKEKPLEQRGVIAEKMVKNFIKKIAQIPGVDFEVRDADVYQDVEQKIDFIIRRKSHARGARVEEVASDAREIGIQFTTALDKVAHKEKQIERVKLARGEEGTSGLHLDDLVLVKMPMGYTRELYAKWSKEKRPGGPEKLLAKSEQIKLLTELLRGVYSDEEINVLIATHINDQEDTKDQKLLPESLLENA